MPPAPTFAPARRRLLAAAPGCVLASASARTGPAPVGRLLPPEPLPMQALGRERAVHVLLPPSHADASHRHPLVVMHDAQNLFDARPGPNGSWGVDTTLAALARDTGFEALVVGIEHGADRRLSELNPWPHPRTGAGEGDAYLDFVMNQVLPWVRQRHRVLDGPEHTAIVGSSLGAVISQHAWHRHPGHFGRVGLLSPAYWVAPQLFDEAAQARAAARVYLHAGSDESATLVDETRRMQSVLAGRGVPVRLHVEPGARHHEAAWRRAFGPMLRWLFELPQEPGA